MCRHMHQKKSAGVDGWLSGASHVPIYWSENLSARENLFFAHVVEKGDDAENFENGETI
jgi:hypothetical protein